MPYPDSLFALPDIALGIFASHFDLAFHHCNVAASSFAGRVAAGSNVVAVVAIGTGGSAAGLEEGGMSALG